MLEVVWLEMLNDESTLKYLVNILSYQPDTHFVSDYEFFVSSIN